MISWGKAFRKAIKTFLYSIGFSILGGIIIGVGTFTGISYDYYGYSRYNFGLVFITLIIGSLIMALGGLASIYKITSELIDERARKDII